MTTTTFANRKIVLVSTPTLKEGSRIAQLYASQPGGVDQVDLAAAALQTFAARIAELETDMHEVPAIYCHPDDFAWAESIHSRFQAPRVPLLIASNSVPRGQIIAAHYNRGTGIPVPAVVLERAA